MDYDDLLLQWARLVREFPGEREAEGRKFTQILIDEMQDTNAVQIEVVEAIAAAGPGNLTAVGDDAQSIYRFRGRRLRQHLRFPGCHPGRAGFPARSPLLDPADRCLHARVDRPQPEWVFQGLSIRN